MDFAQKPLVIPIFIPHSGCPHQCAFCNQSIITQKDKTVPDQKIIDQKTIDQTIDEFLQYKGKRTRVELAFFGGNFLGLPEETIIDLLEMIQPYIHQKKIDSIRFSTRPDTINPDILKRIKAYNISAIELGVQSMNDDILNKAKRGHTHKDTIYAISLLKEFGFKVGVQVMAGLPGDTEESLLESTRRLAKLKPDFARIYPLMVLSGSLVAKWYKQGEYHPLDLETVILQVKQMYQIFSKAKIEVIRMGLQASDFMTDESKVIAGPWHPAFGHLVFSSMMYDQACEKIDRHIKSDKSDSIVLKVHPRSESRLRGDKNNNLRKLHEQYSESKILIQRDDSMPINLVEIQGLKAE